MKTSELHKLIKEFKTMSKWTTGVQEYANELQEFLNENELEPTVENMLNGASDWNQYSYGGSSLIDDLDIAERLATPSEIASRTRKDGSFNQMANARETWLDVQARALFQASRLVLKTNKQSEPMLYGLEVTA